VLDATPTLRRAVVLGPTELRRAARGAITVERASVPGLDERSRILATPLRRDGRTLVLAVGATLQDRAETLSEFRTELAIAFPVALILTTAVGYLLAGLSLRPVDSMRRRAAAISAHTPGQRLPVPATGDEIERLGRTLNEMLDRLEHALQRERDFVADAGHELRTPLAVLRTELELALRHTGSAEELREAVRRSSEEVDRLSQLAGDLLLIARSDRHGGLPLRLEPLPVRSLLDGVAERVAWRAEAAGKQVEVEAADGLVVAGDRLRLEQALGNLVDNALRYGGRRIHLDASLVEGGTRLRVTDDGDGFPEAFLPRAFERFSRADSARGRGGTGLGLAIVRAIAEAHGGSADAGAAPGGGGTVWLDVPDRV
jgi:signal transduction histidine kinase